MKTSHNSDSDETTPRALFATLSHGVYVVGVKDNGLYNAFTAAWVMQVSFKPLLLAVSINPGHTSYRMLRNSGVFSVNVLPSGQLDLAHHFGTPSANTKLANIKWQSAGRDLPVLDDAVSYFTCKFVRECEAGDHVVVIAEVIDGCLQRPSVKPMAYRETGDMDGSSRLFPPNF